jgi:hypothetical protein
MKNVLCVFLASLFLPTVALSQTDAEIERLTTLRKPADAPRIMILGVYHFHNPGADYARFKTADILSEQKQKEVAEVVGRISEFKPTKIAIEWTTDRTAEANRLYADYQQGKFSITEGEARIIGSEAFQLGFQLAKAHRHKQLYPVDYPGGMDINSVLTFAQQRDPEYVKRFQKEIGSVVNLMNQMQQSKSVLEILKTMNTEGALSIAQSTYTDMATVGAGDNYIGASVVADWYKRNLRIFANLSQIAEPNDRILLIIGVGHKPILQQLVKESARLKLVDVLDYL